MTCLAVDGNLAAHTTVMVKSTNPDFPPGTQSVEVVRDRSLPGGEGDGWFIYDVPPADPSDCADFLDEAATAPEILSGKYPRPRRVTDSGAATAAAARLSNFGEWSACGSPGPG